MKTIFPDYDSVDRITKGDDKDYGLLLRRKGLNPVRKNELKDNPEQYAEGDRYFLKESYGNFPFGGVAFDEDFEFAYDARMPLSLRFELVYPGEKPFEFRTQAELGSLRKKYYDSREGFEEERDAFGRQTSRLPAIR